VSHETEDPALTARLRVLRERYRREQMVEAARRGAKLPTGRLRELVEHCQEFRTAHPRARLDLVDD